LAGVKVGGRKSILAVPISSNLDLPRHRSAAAACKPVFSETRADPASAERNFTLKSTCAVKRTLVAARKIWKLATLNLVSDASGPVGCSVGGRVRATPDYRLLSKTGPVSSAALNSAQCDNS
jgi:hypothetical protein